LTDSPEGVPIGIDLPDLRVTMLRGISQVFRAYGDEGSMKSWSQGKPQMVCTLLICILCLAASFFTFDWTQYYFGIVRISDPELMYSRVAKTLTSFLIFLLAISVGDDGINAADPVKLRRCFLAIFGGDLLFLLDEIHPYFDYCAIVVFLCGHIFIILRNGQGMRDYLRRKSRRRDFTGDIVMGTAILIGSALLFTFTLLGNLKGSPLLYILIVYAAVLVISLWTGWTTLHTGYFPKPNAIMIAIGATCFFIGDFLVGFNLSLPPSLERSTTLFMTWIFYTPAIALFALSGYRWSQ
jgi:hypothetical protein